MDEVGPAEHASDPDRAAQYAREWIDYVDADRYGNPSNDGNWTDVLLDWSIPMKEPHLALDAIIMVLDATRTETPHYVPYIGVLASGAMENLLSYHGAAVIDRVEAFALARADFAFLLGGVWQNDTPDHVWARVQACASEPW